LSAGVTIKSLTIFEDQLFVRARDIDHTVRTYQCEVDATTGTLICVLTFINHTTQRDGSCKSFVVHKGRKMILMGGCPMYSMQIGWLLCDGTELGLSLPLAHTSLLLQQSCVIQNDEHMARFLCIFSDEKWKRWYYILSIPSSSSTCDHSWSPFIVPVDQRHPEDFLL
jgi:hypothetical protein